MQSHLCFHSCSLTLSTLLLILVLIVSIAIVPVFGDDNSVSGEAEVCLKGKLSRGHYEPVYPHSDWLGGRCNANDFEKIKSIGHGGIAKVWLAKHKPSGKKVAIKITHNGAKSHNAQVRIRREECNQHKIHHRNAHRHYCTIVDGNDVGLVIEYIDGVTLYEHVRSKGGARDPKKLVFQLFEVLSELHEAHIAHRDFKSKNIMVTRDGDIKLIDFGASARYINSHDRALFQTNRDGDSHHYRKEPFSMAIDWARFGIVMYEIITGRLPLGDRKVPIADGCLNGKLFKMLKCDGKLHGDACDLFKHFIQADWQNRWGMSRETREKVRKHPWFKGLGGGKVANPKKINNTLVQQATTNPSEPQIIKKENHHYHNDSNKDKESIKKEERKEQKDEGTAEEGEGEEMTSEHD